MYAYVGASGLLAARLIRFIRLRVPQWREDVLSWAAKQGYKETGGGLWGEMDGEDAMELTRPTQYFDMTVRESLIYYSNQCVRVGQLCKNKGALGRH